MAAVAISSARSADSMGPTKSAAAGTVRRPVATLKTSTEPSSRHSTAGISAAGSAWTRLPTVVPRLRIVGCATYDNAWVSRAFAGP